MDLTKEVDFAFALTWNCYGISSYDSQTGKLVKTTDATNSDDYVTYYQLTDQDKEYIKAENIALSFTSEDEKGQAFLYACEAISNRLTSTEEWKALPDYENLYQ